MPPIPGDWIATAGPTGLLALAVLLIFMGWLVPRPEVRRREQTIQRLERERDQWQAVALKAMGHTDALIPVTRTVNEFTQSLSDAMSPSEEQAS